VAGELLDLPTRLCRPYCQYARDYDNEQTTGHLSVEKPLRSRDAYCSGHHWRNSLTIGYA
jgi:hypothetical protein